MSLVLLVSEDGKNLGEMPMEEAERIAAVAKRDLQLVDGERKVYRIVDAGRLEYERKKKIRQHKAQQRTHKVKEIKFGIATEAHDLEIKVRRIREFLERGLKTKITMQFKGRQLSFQAAGLEKMNAVLMAACEGGLAKTDRDPKFEGRNLIVFLTPIKQNPTN